MFHLLCVHEYGNYAKGQLVTDDAEIQSIIAANRRQQFVRIEAHAANEPEPAPAPAPAAPVAEEHAEER